MNKSILQSLLSKISLGGILEKSTIVSDGKLTTSEFYSSEHSLVGSIKMVSSMETGEFPLPDLSRFSSLLSVLEESVKVNPVVHESRPVALQVSDGRISTNVSLADKSIIEDPPRMKDLPSYDLIVNLNEEVTNSFMRSSQVMSELERFSVKGEGKEVYFIFGESNINTNRIKIKVDYNEYNGRIKELGFSSKLVRNILSVNRDAENSTLSLIGKGLMKLSFKGNGFESEYYLTHSK